MKSDRIQEFFGPYFVGFGLNKERCKVQMRENTDQKNSKYRHFSRSNSPADFYNHPVFANLTKKFGEFGCAPLKTTLRCHGCPLSVPSQTACREEHFPVIIDAQLRPCQRSTMKYFAKSYVEDVWKCPICASGLRG